MSAQAPSSVILIRPHGFTPNPLTIRDNAFQTPSWTTSAEQVSDAAYSEVTELARTLQASGVDVNVFEEYSGSRPDSVFPNNWISTHAGGHVAVFPMYVRNRRKERRTDILEFLKRRYRVQDIIDYSGLEHDQVFLEGTGAMVLDHVDKVAYAARSNRTDPIALERFCTNFGYEPMVFDSLDSGRTPIYHTNVMMCIATDFALVGLETIPSPGRRQEVIERLESTGRTVIGLTHEQVNNFAGNAIELQGRSGRLLALSERAERSLTQDQKQIIQASCDLLPVGIPTIELAGGSVRCMIVGVHLNRRNPDPEWQTPGPQTSPIHKELHVIS